MLIVFIRAVILYIIVIISVRIMGKRQIGELQPTELVITILVSNIATLPLEDLNIPLITGIIPILLLVCFDVIMSGATLKFRNLRRVVSGTAKVVIRDGKIEQGVLKELRFSIDDLMVALRGKDVFDISEVQFAVIETNGKISVYKKFANTEVTNQDLKINGTSKNPPMVVIEDGVLVEHGLREIEKEKSWVEEQTAKKHLTISQVFLMTADRNGKVSFIEKNRRDIR